MTTNGSVELTLNASTTFTLTAANAVGVASGKLRVTVLGDPEPLPEGSFGEEYQEYIPADATIDSYEPSRFALVSGAVEDSAAVPLSGVAITVLNVPEYGTAYTDINGVFRLPVEGGGVVTLNYEKEGYIGSQRQVDVPWTNAAVAETVTLIQADAASSTITLDGNPETIITHTSSETPATPTEGARECTLVLTGDTNMYQTNAEGQPLQELNTVTLRATEYKTPEAMPAKLPPMTQFTYCANVSIDGASNVSFDKPVYMWVNNFLGFAVGGVVPVGYYDKGKGVWVPSDNGIVVRVLDTDTDGFVDALDSDGDGQRNDINGDGTYDDEVAGLTNRQWNPNRNTFWRVPITHLTEWDCNWGGRPCDDCVPPTPPGDPGPGGPGPGGNEGEGEGEGPRDPKSPDGCYVDYREGVFHEDVAIPGTGLTLHYASRNVPGYQISFHVPVTGSQLSPLVKAHVQVLVAGRILQQDIDTVTANQAVDIPWDGLDLNGVPVTHTTVARVRVGYEYQNGTYVESREEVDRAFAMNATTWEPAGPSRDTVIGWVAYNVVVVPSSSSFAEGWSISAQHQIDPLDPSMLYKGDGMQRGETRIINTVAGNGTYGQIPTQDDPPGTALKGLTLNGKGLRTDVAGNFYFISNGHMICKVTPDDKFFRVTTPYCTFLDKSNLGDGGPSTEATTRFPRDLATDATGNLFIADTENDLIRKVGLDGNINSVAEINRPTRIGVDTFGNVYVLKDWYNSIVQISPGGDQRVIVPAGSYAIQDLAIDPQGNVLYIYNYRYIRKIEVASNTDPVQIYDFKDPLDGLDDINVEGLTTDSSGQIYVSSRNEYQVYLLGRENNQRIPVLGNGTYTMTGDGGPATAAGCLPEDIAFDAAGSLYVNSDNKKIRKANSPFSSAGGTPASSPVFADTNGLKYIFDQDYLHQSTVDAETEVTLLSFGYNAQKQLVSITDRFSRAVTIQRDAQGRPAAIVNPDGITTTLTVDENNRLTDVQYPDGGAYHFGYSEDGLMTDEIANGRHYYHRYDPQNGRIIEMENPLTGITSYSAYSADDTDQVFRMTTSESDITEFKDHYDSGAFTSVTTDPDGTVTTYNRSADGLSSDNTTPDGVRFDVQFGFDLEKRTVFKKSITTTTPGGLTQAVAVDRQKVGDSFVETVAVNGKTTTLTNDVVNGTLLGASPAGRTLTTHYDPQTLLTTSTSIPGLWDTTYQYDNEGRVINRSTDTRGLSYTYDADGRLDTVSEPVTGTVGFDYDGVGRVTSISQPDTHTVGFDYDLNGNLTALTTPLGKVHSFAYNALGLCTLYTTPLNNMYEYGYDDDKRLTSVTFPSAQQTSYSYSLGRLESVTEPGGIVTNLTYDPAGRLLSQTRGAESVSYAYNGSLPTSVTYTGVLSQAISATYNNDLLPQSVTYAGSTANYGYDDDGLLTQVGAFTITRDEQNGLPTLVSDNTMMVTPSYNGYGEVTGAATTVNNINVAEWDVTYDNAARITGKTETIGNGNPSIFVYTYDNMSRLDTVHKNGILVEDYNYDDQGRRIRTEEDYQFRYISNRSATYYDDDRLETSGDYAYEFDADGFLTAKTDTSTLETTTYTYARNGQLNSVTLPDTTVIEYVHNAAGQRVAKKVGGVITEKYLWAGITGLLAVYDGANNLVIRFEGAKMVKNGQTYYLITDQVGSIRAVCDTSGNIVKEITYDSFGNILDDTAPTFTIPLGFAGGLHDRDTNLVHFGFRDYDADSGRWTAKDVLGFAAGSTDFYAYCSSDPVGLFDPLGLDGQDRVNVALGSYGSTEYSTDGWLNWKFQWTDYKCNAFVYDVITQAGDWCPLTQGHFWRRYPPTAGDWGDPKVKIPGYIVVTDPKPGDIVGERREGGDATGHCGIVYVVFPEGNSGRGLTISAASDRVVITRFGFRESENVVYRRPISEVAW